MGEWGGCIEIGRWGLVVLKWVSRVLVSWKVFIINVFINNYSITIYPLPPSQRWQHQLVIISY